ncbi:MAG: hypothetical protein Q9M89_00765 [Persephonella sp.]|nr:hypothetical protein [Persephonella sp.]
MSIPEIEQKLDCITEHFCCLLSKTNDCKMREELFKTYYETILFIQDMHFHHVCRECKSRKRTAYIFMEE